METVSVFPDQEKIALHSEVKRKKMQYAVSYLSTLGESGLAFAGISGSVSYEPKEQDDVDIFLIANDGRLWEVIFRAFIRRRILGMHDICLSLCMSASYASKYSTTPIYGIQYLFGFGLPGTGSLFGTSLAFSILLLGSAATAFLATKSS